MKLDRTLGIAMLAIGSLLLAHGALAGGGQPPSNIFIGPDTNGDGNSDPILEDSASGFAISYEMNGLSQIQADGVPGTYSPYSTVGFRDIDGDGKSDKIMEDTSNGYTVAIRSAVTAFDTAVSIPGSYGDFETRAGIDVDGDGNVDKVMEDSVTGYTVVSLLDANPANWVSDEIPGSYGAYEMTNFADVNGDGTNDKIMQIASGPGAGYTLGVMLNPNLTYTMIELPASYGTDVTLGYPDLNGDGQADQVIRQGASETDPVVGCIYGAATGPQMAVTCNPISATPVGMFFDSFVDLNGDKKEDRLFVEASTGDLYAITHDGTTELGGPSIVVSAPASTYGLNEFDDFGYAGP